MLSQPNKDLRVFSKKKKKCQIFFFWGFKLSIHIGRGINLAIWFHKKLLYLSYLLTLQNTKHSTSVVLF